MSMDPLAELGRKMRDLAQSLGCDMDAFVLIPDLDGNSHICQVVFVLPELEEKPLHPDMMDGVDIDAEAAAFLASIETHEIEATRQSTDADAVERMLGARDKLRGSEDDESSH